jgi:murein DD-endopeptidase MepM/ murein hydrolase activator NlpD
MLDKILQQISGIGSGAKSAGEAVQAVSTTAAGGGGNRPDGGNMMPTTMGTISSGTALPNSNHISDHLGKISSNQTIAQTPVGRPMPTGVSRGEIGLAAVSAGVSAASAVGKTAFSLLPNVDATIARMSDYYSAGLRQPGMSMQGMQALSMGTGLSATGRSGEIMNYLSSQGVSASSGLMGQQATQIANASKYLGMDPMAAAQAINGLTNGAGSSNMMRNFGIYTSDPNTGRPLTQTQIFDQIHGQLTAGREKATVQQVNDSFNRGNLGASLQAAGMDEATVQMYHLYELSKAQGKTLDLNDSAAMEAYREEQIQAGNINPNEAAQQINTSTEGVMNNAQDEYVAGLKAGAAAITFLNDTIVNALIPALGGPNAFMSLAAGNNPLGAIANGVGGVISGAIGFGASMLSGKLLGGNLLGGGKGTVPPIEGPKVGPVGSGEVKAAQDAAADAAKGAASSANDVAKAVSGVAKEASAFEKVIGSLSKVVGPVSKTLGALATPLMVAQVGLEAANKSVEYGQQAVEDPTKNMLETAHNENASNWDAMLPWGKKQTELREKAQGQWGNGDWIGALGTQVESAFNMSPLGAIGNFFTGVANYIGGAQVELNKGSIGSTPTPPPGYVEGKNGMWSNPSQPGMVWNSQTRSLQLSGGYGGLSSTIGGANGSTSAKSGAQTAPSKPSFIMPIDGKINEGFGPRDTTNIPNASKNHRGIDIDARDGTPTKATADGTVTQSSWENSGGNVIMLEHTNGYRSRYLHMSKSNVSPGAVVRQGQIIGLSGNTGSSSYGAHLHFEIHLNGTAIDPLTVIGAGNVLDIGFDQQEKKQPEVLTTSSGASTQEGIIGSMRASVASHVSVGSVGSSSSAGSSSGSKAPSSSKSSSSGSNAPYMPHPSVGSGHSSGQASGKGGDDKNQMRLGQLNGQHTLGADQMKMWRDALQEAIGGRGTRAPNNVTINVSIAQASQAEAQRLANMVKQYLEDDVLLNNMARK